jgi:hypothetical protein
VEGVDVGKLAYSGRLFRQVVGYAMDKKAYWIIPLVILLALLSFVVVSSQTVVPALYAIF